MTEPVTPVEKAANENRRAMILLAVAGGLLVLFLLSRVLFGGGGGGGDDVAQPAPTPAGPVVTAAPTTTVTAIPETFQSYTMKNPFLPPSFAIGTGLTGGGGTGTGTGGTGGSGTTPTTITGTVTPGNTATTRAGTTPTSGGTGTGRTTPTSAAPAAEPRRGERLALIDVFTDAGRVRANVRVGDTSYRVGSGETFATSYRVISLDAGTNCGRFVFGDDQFRLCTGEEVIK